MHARRVVPVPTGVQCLDTYGIQRQSANAAVQELALCVAHLNIEVLDLKEPHVGQKHEAKYQLESCALSCSCTDFNRQKNGDDASNQDEAKIWTFVHISNEE